MADPNRKITPFEGTDGTACEQFVIAIQQEAFMVSKQSDDLWVARFAGTLLSGRALRWHVLLPMEQKRSWKALRKALLDDYGMEEGDVDARREPME